MKIGFGVAALLLISPAAAADTGPWEAVRAVDARMASIAYRLATGNAALCRELQPVPGLQLHAIDQYGAASRAAVRTAFGFTQPVQVEAVVPDSPAAAAGVMADDAVVMIGDDAVPAPAGEAATSMTRDAALALLAEQEVTAPLRLTLERAGQLRTATIAPSPGCASGFEVLLGSGMTARSDGRTVQVGARYFERLDDQQVAAVVAHELAHTILRHRVRLEAAGVRWGVLAQFGRNARLFRHTEEEADRLSVHLLHNADYDPHAAVRFWAGEGGRIAGGLFRGPTHPPTKTRINMIAAEIAVLPPAGPSLPPLLAGRDEPLR
ncbi:M48 family metallopeptidase [Sphingomonas sp.]|jgi:hypothetical protein|uniref:M48 family metallopeptidase n=1 Tax=Sphingomonas sp. TaxID=28214 RepID=UPI002D7F9515|nr:M48 family metallopeptidase [Sphingomonas sp.]HEU0044509.1 M48 family metallopeptidase [Sphingomonas sp.]